MVKKVAQDAKPTAATTDVAKRSKISSRFNKLRIK
jgi:hypothetical protein